LLIVAVEQMYLLLITPAICIMLSCVSSLITCLKRQLQWI